ncbi:MAG: hypothetical protein QXI27_01200 [Nitrososphaerota archaeon]
MLLPQEIEARIALPLIRALIVQRLVKKYGFTQEKTAKALGITQAAVSNYLRHMRARTKILENSEFLDYAVEEIVKLIINNESPKVVRKKLYETLARMRKEGLLCTAHKCLEPDLDEECDICKE